MSLVCKDICKAFGSVVALNGANISIEKGEIRALLGGNGSGKSTLAKILAGSVKRDKGDIVIGGKEYNISSPDEAKCKKVVMTSQELSLFDNLTVEENLCICNIPVCKKIIADKKQMREKALTVLKRLKLEHVIEKRIDTLSSNEQYMIEFAKALLQEPEVLIVDEITSALYSADVEIVKTILHELRGKECIILFITHRMSEIFSICDSVTVMRNGETIADYKTGLVDANRLLSQMTGKDIVTENIHIDQSETKAENNGKTLLNICEMPVKGFDSTVNLKVKEGEVIGIAGLEGHGQSMLVRQLFGIMGGVTLEIDGVKKTITHPRQAVREGIAFISGNRETEGVFGVRSIENNIGVVAHQVLKKKVDEERILHEYNVVYGSMKNTIRSLSGGNQQKVVIGRWLSCSPKILLADDPTKGIDVQARKDLHEIFCALAAAGSVVLMVSSDEEELIELAHMYQKSKVIVMYEGNIVQTLIGADINKDNIAAAAMHLKGGSKN